MAGVTSNYPASIDSESNIIPPNNGDTLTVPGHWLAGNNGPIVNVQNELGTDPSGSFSTVKARLDDMDKNVITDIDMWQVTAGASNQTGNMYLTSNWARSTTTSLNQPVYKGGGLNAPVSGDFTFTSTGIWKLNVQVQFSNITGPYIFFYINSTSDGTNYPRRSLIIQNPTDDTVLSADAIFNITNIANDKFNIQVVSPSGAYNLEGSLVTFQTGLTAMKIGEV